MLAVAVLSASVSRAPRAEFQDLAAALKQAVSRTESKLGALESWQKKIFADEVVAQSSFFVRGYRPGPGGEQGAIQVDVDQELIRKYLAFYGPKDLKREAPRVGVYFFPERGCVRCMEAGAAIRTLVKSRLEARGLTLIWISDSDVVGAIGGVPVFGKSLDEKVREIAASRALSGALIGQWRQTPVDSIDSAHADEKHFQLRISFATGPDATFAYRHDRQLELLANDPFDPAATKILTEALTEVGARALLAATTGKSGSSVTGEELTLSVTGVRDFFQYSALKTALQQTLNEVAVVHERKLARGIAVFAIATVKTAADVRSKLSQVKIVPEGGGSTQGVALVLSGPDAKKSEGPGEIADGAASIHGELR